MRKRTSSPLYSKLRCRVPSAEMNTMRYSRSSHKLREAASSGVHNQLARLFLPFDEYESVLAAFIGITIARIFVQYEGCIRASVDAKFVRCVSVFIDKLHRLSHRHDRSRSNEHWNTLQRRLHHNHLTTVVQPAAPEVEPPSARGQIDLARVCNIADRPRSLVDSTSAASPGRQATTDRRGTRQRDRVCEGLRETRAPLPAPSLCLRVLPPQRANRYRAADDNAAGCMRRSRHRRANPPRRSAISHAAHRFRAIETSAKTPHTGASACRAPRSRDPWSLCRSDLARARPSASDHDSLRDNRRARTRDPACCRRRSRQHPPSNTLRRSRRSSRPQGCNYAVSPTSRRRRHSK